MTIDAASSGEERSSSSSLPNARLSQAAQGLSLTDEGEDVCPDHESSQSVVGATCNGYVAAAASASAPTRSHSSSSGNLNNIRKTLARWLRLQSRPKSSEMRLHHHRRPRYKLSGWPPRWLRRRSQSPTSHTQRALPPVPPQVAQSPDQVIVRPDNERVSTPELRPEDFPPGVAYLPDGEEDDDIEQSESDSASNIIDFVASIETVKNCDWYWGPICGTAAEQVLQGEPDGSFLVRDSSDDRYIFSLTFKLNGTVRHVRIEHDQGNFSFGSFTRFKSNTIVDFVENAVEHSRSGRYLFFLNRRPTNGPMRVQLLHPVSRVKKVQSLQHMCRFVILKLVPRDHVDQLQVPKRIKEYLKTRNYFSENIEDPEEDEEAEAAELAAAAAAVAAEGEKDSSSGNPEDLYLVHNTREEELEVVEEQHEAM